VVCYSCGGYQGDSYGGAGAWNSNRNLGGGGGVVVGGGGGGGGGADGSVRIEGDDITAIGAVNAQPGSGGYYSPGYQSGGNGGYGRVAVYYTTSFSASISTNYLKHVGVEQSDSIFGSGFETGDLTEWSSSQTDGGHLSVTASSRYWGYFGLKAQIADNNDLYVQNDTPDSETHYRARFYFDPNSITMAAGDMPVIFAGYHDTTQVFCIQLQKAGGVYQVRISMRSDAGTWTYSSWVNITDGWNALEIEWYAALNTGSMKLWVDGSEGTTVDSVDNDTLTLTGVRLGVMSVPTGTRGVVHFDDFESRRFSQIGTLPDPGLLFPEPSGEGKVYSYEDPAHMHAVTNLSDGSQYGYDENGNMTCRIENDQTYIQSYNAENRISEVEAVTGDCEEYGDTTATWLRLLCFGPFLSEELRIRWGWGQGDAGVCQRGDDPDHALLHGWGVRIYFGWHYRDREEILFHRRCKCGHARWHAVALLPD
jgi:hypothetical protein